MNASPPPSHAFDWPMFGLVEDIRPALRSARVERHPVVLATLYAVAGGAPRGLGAQMVFDAKGPVAGFLSGGCVEADVALHAALVLAERRARRLVYGEGGPADIALPCGSRIDVLLEPIGPDDPAVGRLLTLSDQRRPVWWFSDGERHDCNTDDTPTPGFHPLVRKRFAPAPQVVVIGADPAALATARLFAETGVETTLVRPKGPEAPPPIPLHAYRRDEAGEAIAALAPDPWTAVCVMTHDLTVEHEATAAALRTPAGYIGVLGSRRRAPERLARLAAEGFEPAAIARLHAPIGLPIGGKAPWSIAVAVAAEVMQQLAGDL